MWSDSISAHLLSTRVNSVTLWLAAPKSLISWPLSQRSFCMYRDCHLQLHEADRWVFWKRTPCSQIDHQISVPRFSEQNMDLGDVNFGKSGGKCRIKGKRSGIKVGAVYTAEACPQRITRTYVFWNTMCSTACLWRFQKRCIWHETLCSEFMEEKPSCRRQM